MLANQFGSYAAKLVEIEQYGVTVALVNNHVISNRLEDKMCIRDRSYRLEQIKKSPTNTKTRLAAGFCV